MSDKMIERVAIAAATECGEDWTNLPDEARLNSGDPDRREWREIARAVLDVMREPTEAMIAAGEAWRNHCSDTDSIYAAMVQAAFEGK